METVTPFALSTTALIGYGYGIILAIGGLCANFKIQKTTMKKVADESNEPIKEDMIIVKNSLKEQHKKIINNSIALKKVTDITDPLMVNKVFFCKLMKIAVDSVEYREDKNLTYYNNKVATSLVSFSREIIDYGIEKVSDGTSKVAAGRTIINTLAGRFDPGVSGRTLVDSDENTLYLDNGSSWLTPTIKGINNIAATGTSLTLNADNSATFSGLVQSVGLTSFKSGTTQQLRVGSAAAYFRTLISSYLA